MKATLYGIGVGPGDVDLITVKERNVPIAIVERATWDNERNIVETLDDIVDKVKEANITKCAQILVGDFIDCDYDKSVLYNKTFTHMFREAKE